MKKHGIVIGTSEYTRDFLMPCLRSISGIKYPVLIVSNNGYTPVIPENTGLDITVVVIQNNGFELGAIKEATKHFDDFFHMSDTCIIKDISMFDIMFGFDGSIPMCANFMSYIGKYRTSIINRIDVPDINTKDQAVQMERYWNRSYLSIEKLLAYFDPELPVETEQFSIINGQKRMVCENTHMIKYKGTYQANYYGKK